MAAHVFTRGGALSHGEWYGLHEAGCCGGGEYNPDRRGCCPFHDQERPAGDPEGDAVPCEDAKLARYRPEILTGYTQADVDEPIEEAD